MIRMGVLRIMVVIISCCTIISAQQITRVIGSSSLFNYNNKVYQYSELTDLMNSVSGDFKFGKAPIDHYKRSIKRYKASKVIGFVTLGFIATGIIAPIVDPTPKGMYCDLFCLSAGEAIGIINLLLIAPVLGTTGVFIRIAADSSKRHAV